VAVGDRKTMKSDAIPEDVKPIETKSVEASQSEYVAVWSIRACLPLRVRGSGPVCRTSK